MSKTESDTINPISFYLYRFQLTVTSPTPFQQITIYKEGKPVIIDTPEKLTENRLFIFREILKNTTEIKKDPYLIRNVPCSESEEDQFLMTCQKDTTIPYTENYQRKKQRHQPFVWIAIDTSEHVQTIGITRCKEISANRTANEFAAMFQKRLNEKNLTLEIHPIRPKSTFWEFIKGFDSIKSVSFTLLAPNMSDLNDTFTDELREYTGSTGGMRTQVTTTAHGTNSLELSENNPRLMQMARYSDQGGGSYYIVQQGSTKRISPKGKGVHQTISALPMKPQQGEFPFSNKLEVILTAIRRRCKIARGGNGDQ